MSSVKRVKVNYYTEGKKVYLRDYRGQFRSPKVKIEIGKTVSCIDCGYLTWNYCDSYNKYVISDVLRKCDRFENKRKKK